MYLVPRNRVLGTESNSQFMAALSHQLGCGEADIIYILFITLVSQDWPVENDF
ncbi:MAG: hypothetical protein JWP89_1644 [Schlesneria sp.]|nr:hypothetical protein [Schlesneria sp.]